MRKMIYIFIQPSVLLSSCNLKFKNGMLILVEYAGEVKYEMRYNAEGEVIYYKDWKGNWYDKSKFKVPYPYHKSFNCFEIYGMERYTNVSLLSVGYNNSRDIMLHRDSYKDHMSKMVNEHGLLNCSIIVTNEKEVNTDNYFQFNDILDRYEKAEKKDHKFISHYLTFTKYGEVVKAKCKE